MSKNPERTEDGQYRGVIYERHNKATDQSYVGKTDNEKIRKQSWNNKGPTDFVRGRGQRETIQRPSCYDRRRKEYPSHL